MEYVLWYLILFLIIFIILYIVEFVIMNKNKNLGLSKSFLFISKQYKLKMNEKKTRKLTKIIVLGDTFILSIPIYIALFSNFKYFPLLGISLLIFIVLILIIYNLIGYILKKKGW